MARMYSRKRGKSGSTKPVRKGAPSWVKYKPEEVKKLVVKLAKKGKSSSKIGTILRDSYGIPDVKSITGEKITKIMENNDLAPDIPEDLSNLIQRVVDIQKHLKSNKGDKVAKRGIQLTEAKIRKLVKYYKRKNKLPEDWKYSRENIELLLK